MRLFPTLRPVTGHWHTETGMVRCGHHRNQQAAQIRALSQRPSAQPSTELPSARDEDARHMW